MSFAGLAAGGENVAVIKKMDLAGFMGENGIVFQISGMEEEDFPENITGKQLFHEGLGAVSGNADDGGLALCEQADFPGAVSIGTDPLAGLVFAGADMKTGFHLCQVQRCDSGKQLAFCFCHKKTSISLKKL